MGQTPCKLGGHAQNMAFLLHSNLCQMIQEGVRYPAFSFTLTDNPYKCCGNMNLGGASGLLNCFLNHGTSVICTRWHFSHKTSEVNTRVAPNMNTTHTRWSFQLKVCIGAFNCTRSVYCHVCEDRAKVMNELSILETYILNFKFIWQLLAISESLLQLGQ